MDSSGDGIGNSIGSGSKGANNSGGGGSGFEGAFDSLIGWGGGINNSLTGKKATNTRGEGSYKKNVVAGWEVGSLFGGLPGGIFGAALAGMGTLANNARGTEAGNVPGSDDMGGNASTTPQPMTDGMTALQVSAGKVKRAPQDTSGDTRLAAIQVTGGSLTRTMEELILGKPISYGSPEAKAADTGTPTAAPAAPAVTNSTSTATTSTGTSDPAKTAAQRSSEARSIETQKQRRAVDYGDMFTAAITGLADVFRPVAIG